MQNPMGGGGGGGEGGYVTVLHPGSAVILLFISTSLVATSLLWPGYFVPIQTFYSYYHLTEISLQWLVTVVVPQGGHYRGVLLYMWVIPSGCFPFDLRKTNFCKMDQCPFLYLNV